MHNGFILQYTKSRAYAVAFHCGKKAILEIRAVSWHRRHMRSHVGSDVKSKRTIKLNIQLKDVIDRNTGENLIFSKC